MTVADPILLTSEFADLTLEIDPRDGAPTGLRSAGGRVGLETSVRLITEGSEVRAAHGGLAYVDTVPVTLSRAQAIAPVSQVSLEGRTFHVAVTTTSPDWRARWRIEFRREEPRLAIHLEVAPERDDAILRNLGITMVARVEDPETWRIQAPGNRLRPDLPLSELAYATTVLTPAGVEGSTGLVALEDTGAPATFLFWPLSQRNYGEIELSPAESGASLDWLTDVAGVPGIGGSLTAGPLRLDLLERDFASVLRDVPEMLAIDGITSPASPPPWGAEVNLYEVQIGFGVFRGGYRYEPYPRAEDLLADLDRISGLGYNCLQIMPRQPYPSYNVHDYDDVTTSWCDEDVLLQIVEACHARGIHVILDILMHGVIDNEAMDAAVAAIDSGPYVERLDEATPDVTMLERDEMHYYLVAWSRHVKDFEPYWRAGSPARHALVDEHPEWFTRDSHGSITGVYTQAFDLAHPGWQDYFVEKAVGLVQRLGIDGYRFDAPSYNYFHNWSERARSDASVSMLGCLPLFRRLRTELRRVHPEALLYTEPSGALYRMSMDVAYNYDEQWLVRAVMTRGAGKSHWVRNARELAGWFAQRDASLPRGTLTAHHLDSHDSFWWPEPGQKWRREVYGVPATAAFMAMFALSGGPYMTYVGGEVEIEDDVRRVNGARASYPVIARGDSDYSGVTVDDDDVYAVLRHEPGSTVLVLVNLSDRRVPCTVSLAAIHPTTASPDILGGPALGWAPSEAGLASTVHLDPWSYSAHLIEDDGSPVAAPSTSGGSL